MTLSEFAETVNGIVLGSVFTVGAVLLILLSCGGGEIPIPPKPKDHVADLTGGYLSPVTQAKLNLDLVHYQTQTQHEVIVWISNKPLGKVPIEQFGFTTFNSWGVGRTGYDDGVVLFVFPSPPGDRLRMRIEVGYGLERALPDRECVRILHHVIAPLAEAGKHDEGIEAGVLAILAAVDGLK